MSEADYMWQQQLSEWGAEFGDEPPEFEVIKGKRQNVVFKGSRPACWAYQKAQGGFVRAYSGEDNDDY